MISNCIGKIKIDFVYVFEEATDDWVTKEVLITLELWKNAILHEWDERMHGWHLSKLSVVSLQYHAVIYGCLRTAHCMTQQ